MGQRVGERLLMKAAGLLKGPDSYHRYADDAAINPFATRFHLCSLLERANLRYRSGHVPIYGDPANVTEAKAKLCRYLKVPHITVWEHTERPDWLGVKVMLESAANHG